MPAARELIERELGHRMLELLDEQSRAELLVPAAEQRALGIVRAIQSVLDDGGRTDFDCVEEIVRILERAGVSTSRHDFG